jgi:methylenetetrahydrofolate reductase (NADPH)
VRVDELLANGPTRSFEFFPPKSDEEAAVLAGTLRELEPLKPSFVSVTYRGGIESRQRTFDLVREIQSEGQLTAMAHLICVGHQEAELRDILTNYLHHGVQNLMALGGDAPEDPSAFRGDFLFAEQLVAMAREIGDFSIGVAAHPLGHPRSASIESDRHYLAEKMKLADFAVTQFFFEAHQWVALVNDLADLGVDKPVLPGIMPVTTLRGIAGMAKMGGPVPGWLVARLEEADRLGGKEAVRRAGIEAATEMGRELLDAGAPGLHFYTLNRSTATREIYSQLFP